MKTFKDTNNNLHFLDDASFTNLLPSDCVEITDEEAEAIRVSQLPIIDPQVAINQAALAYLASTDWYVVRFSETGVIVPDAIKALRAEARLHIV